MRFEDGASCQRHLLDEARIGFGETNLLQDLPRQGSSGRVGVEIQDRVAEPFPDPRNGWADRQSPDTGNLKDPVGYDAFPQVIGRQKHQAQPAFSIRPLRRLAVKRERSCIAAVSVLGPGSGRAVDPQQSAMVKSSEQRRQAMVPVCAEIGQPQAVIPCESLKIGCERRKLGCVVIKARRLRSAHPEADIANEVPQIIRDRQVSVVGQQIAEVKSTVQEPSPRLMYRQVACEICHLGD